MTLLGVTDEDLEPLSLQSFTKTTKSREEAMILFKKYTEKREELLRQVKAKRDELMLREPPPSSRPSGEVRHKQRMIAQSNDQAAHMEQQNEKMLRRLAIQQLRIVYHQQKYEELSARVDRQASTHSERVTESRRKGQETASARESLHRGADFEPKPIQEFEAPVRRAQLLREEQGRRLGEGAEKVEDQFQRAHHNSERIRRASLERLKRRVDETAERTARIRPMLVERNQELQARAAERQHVALEKQRQVCEIEQQRVERGLAGIEGRSRRSAAVLQKNSEKQRAKIAKRAEDLERRIARSQEILDEIRQQRDESAQALKERQAAVAQRLADLDREKRSKIFERSCNDAQRSEYTRRLARMRQSEAERELRAKVEKIAGTSVDFQAEMTQSLSRKEAARKNFAQRKCEVLRLHRMGHLSETEMIRKLRHILRVDEVEAKAIIRAAKTPSSPPET
jgi:hypothetical protein